MAAISAANAFSFFLCLDDAKDDFFQVTFVPNLFFEQKLIQFRDVLSWAWRELLKLNLVLKKKQSIWSHPIMYVFLKKCQMWSEHWLPR